MDKKEAAAEAIKKAKETQAAAGKATGMSGRDLFSYSASSWISSLLATDR